MNASNVPLPGVSSMQERGAPSMAWQTSPTVCVDEEIADVEALLLEHASFPGALTRHLARALAEASMGPNHLWEDLGLGSRDQLNALMQEYFSSLKALNAHNMRWKKFFYRTLCERAEVLICKSPNCAQCEDQAKCFE